MGFFDVTARDNLINFRNNTIEFFAIKKYFFLFMKHVSLRKINLKKKSLPHLSRKIEEDGLKAISNNCFFFNSQETLTFADSTLSNTLFDDSQNPQSTLSQSSGVVDEIFLTLDNAFSEELNNNNEWNIDRNDIKNWEACEADVVRTNMVSLTN